MQGEGGRGRKQTEGRMARKSKNRRVSLGEEGENHSAVLLWHEGGRSSPSLPKENCPAIHCPLVEAQMRCSNLLVGSFGTSFFFLPFLEYVPLTLTCKYHILI